MRVLLANPPFDEAESVGGTRSMKYVLNTIAPLGLAYLAAVAEQAGHDVHIVDCALGLTLDQLCRRAAALDPQVVGLTCTTPSWAGARDAAKALRRATPRAKLVIGGAHVTALPLATLAGGVFDAGVVGEGEATFAELLEAWASAPDADLAGIAGLVLPGDGQPRLTTPRALIQDVDSIPYPARHLLPRLSAYRPTPASYRRLPLGVVMSSRGCPARCTFCDRAIFGSTYRARSVDNVMGEVEELVRRCGAREIRFFDDTLTLDRRRAFQLCERMAGLPWRLPWTCLTRVNSVTPELLRSMRRAGCWQVLYGLESGDERVLKSLKKGTTVEQNVRAVRWAQDAGLEVRGDFIVGTPAETEESLWRTVQFAVDMKLDYAHFNKFVPLPGTELYHSLVAQGYEFDFEHGCSIIDHSALLYVPESMTREQYRRMLDDAFRTFYLRPSYMLRRLSHIRTPDMIQGQFYGLLALLGV